MTYFERFRRRFFIDVEKLLNNRNRVLSAIPERLKHTTTKDIIAFTLGSLRQELIKIFDEAKQQTQKEKKKELNDIENTRKFLKEVCKIPEKYSAYNYFKDRNTYELTVEPDDMYQPQADYKISFIFDENKNFEHIRIDKSK
jgi:hypothetical protein